MTLPTRTTLAESWSSTYCVRRSRAFSVRVIRVWISDGTVAGASPPAAWAVGPSAADAGDAPAARPAATASGRSALRVPMGGELLVVRGGLWEKSGDERQRPQHHRRLALLDGPRQRLEQRAGRQPVVVGMGDDRVFERRLG